MSTTRADRDELFARMEWNDGTPLFSIAGDLDERTRLHELPGELLAMNGFRRRVTLDLERLEFVNSAGMRNWIKFVAALAETEIAATVRRCPEVMVRQLNMIESARGHLTFESFYAPYLCADCGRELRVLQRAADVEQTGFARVPCPHCPGSQQFDDELLDYTRFLHAGHRHRG
jgi:anti-anti-sigma regulatory factor/DNA-directed RNA polymerase subunit RPC12/RpoP